MTARSPDEPHRASTPLELFFDLVFVVAIGQVASAFHHAIVADHAAQGLLSFVMVFFAIWWAWMNFTWFASAYDPDDTIYRITVMVQLTGALILAAGVHGAFEQSDWLVITIGYVVMRLAMVSQWLRAATNDSAHAATARRYAQGISVVQVGWIALLFVPPRVMLPMFGLLVLAELAVPVWSERASPTPWHAEHITERYGLFTIIVLGESILAATLAIQAALAAGTALLRLVPLILGGLLIVYSAWWLYFDSSSSVRLTSFRRVFAWGYGHIVIFISAAAIGTGFAVAVDHATGHASIGLVASAYALAIPIAVFLLTLWLIQDRCAPERVRWPWLLPLVAVVVLVTPFGPAPALGMGVLMAGAVAGR